MGLSAMEFSTTSQYSTAYGVQAMQNANGSRNDAFGYNVLSKSSGAYNAGFGQQSLQNNTSGTFNVCFGPGLAANTTGSNNTSVGFNVLSSNITSSNNTAIGFEALIFNTASSNTAIGCWASRGNSTGTGNTAIGRTSLGNATTANGNTGIGYLAGSNITTGGFNTIIGGGNASNGGTAYGLTTGSYNIAIGDAHLFHPLSATASRNTLLGNLSSRNISGNENVIIGFGSGDIGVGTKNVLLGTYTFAPSSGNGWAAPAMINTSNNTFIGSDHNISVSAQVAIGNNNTSLGFNINQRIVGITNATAIGANTASTKSNQISMGDANVTEILLSGKLAIDINAIFGAADGTPIVVKTVGGIKTITIQ
jgi:hypothetical protein